MVSQGGFRGAGHRARMDSRWNCGDGGEQAFARAETVRVAERDGEGVGGIGRLGVFGQSQGGGYHLLHLLFGCGTVTGDAGFHFTRRITVGGDGGLRGGEQHHAAHFGELQRGAHIERGEDGFHCDGVWHEFRDELDDQFVNFAQAGGESGARGKLQRTETQQAWSGADEFDDTVAGGSGDGGINAEDAEASVLLYGVRGDRGGSWAKHVSPDKCSARRLRSVVFFQARAARAELAEL